jgi:aryl-alcohol dehydrogenase-like predicted oxidoreductase
MTFGQQNTEAEAHDQLNMAFDQYGINMLDTAEIYPVPTKDTTQGLTDQYIASWLKNRNRGDVIIATKVAGASPNLKYMPGRNGGQTRVSKEQITTSVDFSLKRLGTEYIDLIQIHWPGPIIIIIITIITIITIIIIIQIDTYQCLVPTVIRKN